MPIALYDASNIASFKWPRTLVGRTARQLLLPMMLKGAPHFITNVKTDIYLLVMDDLLIPLTVNEREYSNSYLTSNYFLISGEQEKVTKHSIRYGLLSAAGNFFRGVKINRAVLVNNWLISSNLMPPLTLKQVNEMTNYLVERFPTHTINIRTLMEEQLAPFQELKYGIYRAREFYGYKSEWKDDLPSKARYHARRDRRLLGKTEYRILKGKELVPCVEQIARLNRYIYVEKHTQYGPEYTPQFFEAALKAPLFGFTALEKEGTLKAVFASFKRGGRMCIPIFGYDQEAEDWQQIYRMMTRLVIDEAEASNLFLHDGTGGDFTKSQRGLQSFTEYAAVYGRHLPALRRSFWALADHFTISPTVKW